MAICTEVKPITPVRIALEIMSIQTHIFKLLDAVPYDEKYLHFRNRLVDASINLDSASFSLDLPDNENV